MSFLLWVSFVLFFLAFITAQVSVHGTTSFAENKSLREGRGRIKPLKGGFLEKVLASKSFKAIVNSRRLDTFRKLPL